MTREAIPPAAQMMQFILGKWISKPIHVAATLGIPDILAAGHKDIAEIAEMTETDPDTLYRLMRALSSVGIFAEAEGREFLNTPLSECLTANRLKAASLLFHSEWHDRMWDNLLYSVQTGEPAFEKLYGEPAFAWLDKHPDEARIFHEANAFKASSSHRVIVDIYDFEGIGTLTDVGGGLGGLMGAILEANPMMRGVVAELPETVRHLRETNKMGKYENRMSVVECDFFKEIPAGSDAYLLSHVIHDWPDESCVRILRNCRKAMAEVGKVLIVEAIIPPGNTPSISKLLDLEVLLMGGGRERSEEEFKDLLKRSGFRLSRIIHAGESVSIIEGTPH